MMIMIMIMMMLPRPAPPSSAAAEDGAARLGGAKAAEDEAGA